MSFARRRSLQVNVLFTLAFAEMAANVAWARMLLQFNAMFINKEKRQEMEAQRISTQATFFAVQQVIFMNAIFRKPGATKSGRCSKLL